MGSMLKKNHVIALPLLLALAALAFAANAHAFTAWNGSSTATVGNTATIEPPVAAMFEGDPDVPTPNQQKRLGVAGPSDVTLPATIRNTWLGHGRVWLRVYLSRWFSR